MIHRNLIECGHSRKRRYCRMIRSMRFARIDSAFIDVDRRHCVGGTSGSKLLMKYFHLTKDVLLMLCSRIHRPDLVDGRRCLECWIMIRGRLGVSCLFVLV
jgi:hypothetical protein